MLPTLIQHAVFGSSVVVFVTVVAAAAEVGLATAHALQAADPGPVPAAPPGSHAVSQGSVLTVGGGLTGVLMIVRVGAAAGEVGNCRAHWRHASVPRLPGVQILAHGSLDTAAGAAGAGAASSSSLLLVVLFVVVVGV